MTNEELVPDARITAREYLGRQENAIVREMLQRQMILEVLRQDIDDETKADMLFHQMILPYQIALELYWKEPKRV